MLNPDEISIEIQEIMQKHVKLIKLLEEIPVINRNSSVQKKYQAKVKQKAAWLFENNIDEDTSPHEKETQKNDCQFHLENTILQIQNQPKHKILLIQQFLEILQDINDEDKKVLLENFKNLSEEQLKRELQTLCEIFGS